ncbi:helix-turn-helix transcriptional regulator [Amycolatopsis rhabdoformis]|uniref:Helix-turn-helix transcriptional regulator n=1 Tax=Amycolatopsis rhabdoformis TaxID=1448059 RepID=A0ABZ1I8B1_9PSEU|nr:helix-turn-helix transcriptional regulator [Amycolatopsis rhabdoformis]WSE30660.1 helix-turn-helix transcriptional regulator [Amycolatopsis rhabdoformis]
MANSPTMRRKRLGAELRRLRGEADVSAEQAAEVLDCSVSRIGHFENGRNAPRKPDLQVLLDFYGVSAEVRAVLEQLRKEGTQRGWWATYKLPPWLQTYVGMEADATSIRVFEIELVTALLQTKAYARRVQNKRSNADSTEADERFASARIRRQQVLDEPGGPSLSAILSESALLRAAHEPDVGAEQLRHLVTMSKKPNISIRVLPLAAGLHSSMSGSFHLLDFDPEVSTSVAYQEYAVGGHLIDDPDVVGTLGELHETLKSAALGEVKSRSLIERLARETG